MISDAELFELFDKVVSDYSGQIDDLSDAIGLIVIGRFFGWRVARLVSPSKTWTKATRLFGDPKLLMPERGRYAHKSLGLRIVDRLGGYWDYIRGSKPMEISQKRAVGS